ncbi:O-antigen ligase family protein [bacterium]|nr:O-antigen ligase family protein [bacterium]
MTAALRLARPAGLRLGWRRFEWWGASVALFLTSGAVFPLLLLVKAGTLGEAERARLQLLQLPIYLIALTLLARYPGQVLLAARRTLPIVALVILAFASTLWSIEPQVTLRRAIGLLMAVLLGYLLAIRFTPRQLLVLVSMTVGVSLFLSLILMAAAPSVAFMPDGTGLRGVFTHKNVLGWAACVGVILALGLFGDAGGRLRLWAAAMLTMSLICLMLAGSATSLFAVVVGAVLFGLYRLLYRTRGLSQGVLILLALEVTAIILLFLYQFLVPLLESLGKDATLTGRVPLWALVDTRIAQRPWLGYGYQAFWAPGKQQALWIAGILQWSPPHSHNGYLDILLNFGVLGLAIFALAVVQTIRRGASLHCAAPQEGWAWMNVMVGVMLTLNLTESNLLSQNDLWWLIMMTIIASFALRWTPDRVKSGNRHPRSG